MRNRLTESPDNPVYEALAAERSHRRRTNRTDESGEERPRAGSLLEESRRSAARLMASHPLIGLATAVSFGIALGWWVKRK